MPPTSALRGMHFQNEFSDIECSFSVTEPVDDPFRRGILGKRTKEDPDLDADVLSQSFSIRQVAVYRYDQVRTIAATKIISI